MKASLLAVAVLATIAISSAVDEVCVQRQVRGLPVHWPNPADCTSFYRCTNKNVKRELLCPAGKEYNPKTGRCANLGRNLCKLSLRAPIAESTNPCADQISGTFVAEEGSCRNFNICNDNVAYPQSCDAGSYFDSTSAACEPDTDDTCWENLCLTKANGVYVANADDCNSFYICDNENAYAQECPTGSYFNKEDLNCQPGECPSDVTTPTTPSTDTVEVTTPTTTTCTEEVTTPTTTTCTAEVTTPTTTTCTVEVTTPTTTTTTCTVEVTTPTTTTCTEEVTTPTTTTCTEEVTTPTTTTCTEEVTTPTTTCTEEVTTPTTTTCTAKVTTPTTTTCTEEVTTPTTTTCTEEVTTPTTTLTEEITTPTTTLTEEITTPTTTFTEEVTTPTTTCTEEVTTPTTTTCTAKVTTPTTTCTEEGTTPTTTLTEEITTPTTTFTEEVTTPTTTCTDEVTTPTTTCAAEITTPTTTTCTEEVTTPTTTLTEEITTPTTTFTEEDTTPTTTTCTEEVTTPTTTTCTDKVTTPTTTTTCAAEITTPTTPTCTEEVTTPTTTLTVEITTPTTTCTEEVTTPTTTLTEEITTPTTTTTCAAEITTPTTTTCSVEVTTPTTTTCTEEITTPTTTVTEEITTPTTTVTEEITTPTTIVTEEITTPTTTTCTEDITTPTTICTDVTTIASTEACTTEEITTKADDATDLICDASKCLNQIDNTVFPALNTNAGFCKCLNEKPVYQECPDDSIFEATVGVCVAQSKVCPSSECLNKPDYTNFPAADTTTGFCTCLDSVATYHDCADTGYIFNADLGICVQDESAPACGANKCLNQSNFTNFPAANTTTGFCTCQDNVATYHDCPETGYTFNAELGICVQNESDCEEEPTTAPLLCEGGYSEGDFIQDSDNCMLFYICYEGELVPQSCGTGNYFDDQLEACVADTDGKCPQCTETANRRNKRSLGDCPGGYINGQMSPDPTNMNRFFICFNGQQMLQECGGNNYFNPATLVCERAINKAKVAVSTCVDNTFSCDPTSCYSYYVCLNNEQILRECTADSYFNSATLSCEVDTQNVCRPKSDDGCTCPGGYKEGEMSPHPTECNKYYICVDSQQIEQSCGTNNYFNNATNECEPDVNNQCIPLTTCTCPGGYEEGEMSPHPTDCNKFYICTDSQQVEQECGTNNYFNNKTMECEPDVDHICIPQIECTCPGGYTEGQISAHPTYCYEYYICSGGQQILHSCGVNNYFNNVTLECQQDTEYVCWANECADQTNGTLVANPQQCDAYFLCEGQKPTAFECTDGQWFDASQSSCQPDVNAVCYNPCANDASINLLPHPDCSKYYFCNGPQTIVGQCLTGGFDVTSGICNSSLFCSDNICEIKPNGYVYADPDDVTKFYICLSGVPQLISCEPNYQYNPDMEICTVVSSSDCDPTPCQTSASYVPPYPTLNATEDNAFCLCKGNIAFKEYCETDMVFNDDIGVCYSNAPCDPTVCLDSPEYTVAPNRNDTQSFCLCVSETPVIVQCPSDGTFNPFTLLCTDIPISSQCNQNVCFDQSDYYMFDALNATDNGFCMCKEHIATFVPCPEDTTYNGVVCMLADINCNSKQCTGLVDNTKIPAVTNNQGYCVCNAGKATYVNCPSNGEFDAETKECLEPVCDQEVCATAPLDYSFPATNTTTGFCMCVKDVAEYYDCPTGQNFNAAIGVCTVTLEACENSMCSGQPDYSAVPAWNTTAGFCYCLGGVAHYEDCTDNYVFNAAMQFCEFDIEALCGNTTYCDTCLADKTCNSYPAINNPNGFCLCYGTTVPTFEVCPPGRTFDTTLLVCIETPASNCDLALCSSATVDNPITAPTLSGNESFCYCSGPDNVMILNCPDGKYYNVDLKLCTNKIEESCSCPNGLLNGDQVADETTCNKYFVCTDGVLNGQTCDDGQYFNADTNLCTLDTEGICTNLTECTCLGAYREGERIIHPVNTQMYYICQNAQLQERNCGMGRMFNKAMNQCIKVPSLNNKRFPQKRSVDIENDNEFLCLDNEKRSVPSNCSQFEICLNQTWKRKTCTNFRYYNPEQQKCLEPRDDLVCSYAKITTLPNCNNEMEQQVHKGKTCQQYYRCQKEKWRLKSCGKQQYFSNKLKTCMNTIKNDEKSQCEMGGTTGNETLIMKELKKENEEQTCQHLSIKNYGKNCAMYLICLDNEWWYQYCPQGMFFQTTLNYCVQDTQQECPQVIRKISKVLDEEEGLVMKTEEFLNETCPENGLLRPSALACNRYFICIKSKWQIQHCNYNEYYDVSNSKCSPDSEGICLQLKMDCVREDKRISTTSCSAYEECSNEGKWLRKECPVTQMYDEVLKECIPNNGFCSKHGFRRACNVDEIQAVSHNCSMFYYCSLDSWLVGSCLKGFMYSPILRKCLPHSLENKCEPLMLNTSAHLKIYKSSELELCKGQLDGVSVAHPTDCTRYYICIQEQTSPEMQCSKGSYFEASLSYCRPNDGTCRLPLTGVCENAIDGSSVAHPTDCQSYYKCSTINGTELMQCPQGEYYHKFIKQCRIDHGECKKEMAHTCFGMEHGTRLPHETYCNIYYACVKNLAIPVECPDNYEFNAILGKCVYDEYKQCQDGQLVDGNPIYSCGNIPDGTYLPDRKDCTRYYICTQGQALPKKCSGSTYFDSESLLCVPDDGSCPYVDEDVEQNNPVPPDPIVCEDKHGYLMPDPFNCNNFYACVHNKLKHERCYAKNFFNTTISQCQLKPTLETQPPTETDSHPSGNLTMRAQKQCSDESTSIEKLCTELAEGSSVADQADCRLYITCQESGESPLSQRCRNGESFDSLLGFCRQNDGTCLLENGQRVGECSGKHGQLSNDANNCRDYFMCINGQKIAKSCQNDEYFSKTQNMCLKDTLQMCNPNQQPDEQAKQSCTGLSESILYPYVHDNCRSYFQCTKGVAKIHKCADDLYFDPIAIKCVKEISECIMPPQGAQRSPEWLQSFSKLCTQNKLNHPYVNLENQCRSFYICHENGEVTHELCPLGMMFNKEFNVCMPEDTVKCY